MTYHAGSRRELAALAAALLLPIPLLAASGLVLPLRSGVERGISLLPGLGDDGAVEAGVLPPSTSTSSTSIRVLHAGAGRAGTDQPAAGVLSEGGNAAAPAAGYDAADGSRSAGMLPGAERRTPGGDGPPQPSAAPDSTSSSEKPAAPVSEKRIAAGVTAGIHGLQLSVDAGTASAVAAVDVSEEEGVLLAVDASTDDDTSAATTVTIPAPSLPLPLP